MTKENVPNLCSNSLMENIMDKNICLDLTIDEVKRFWSFKSYTEKSEFDIACIFYTILERSANITIPKYKSLRPKSPNDEEITEPKTGKIVSLVSNKDLFSFSVNIFDEAVNDFRSFNITDPRGNFYLRDFKWDIAEEEDEYLVEHRESLSNQFTFKNFVHPDRSILLYDRKYFITKALIQRITDECKDVYAQIKAMLKHGIEYPEIVKKTKTWTKSLKPDGKTVTFKSLEVEVDFPTLNEFLVYAHSQENLVYLTELRKKHLYTILPTLRFTTRCIELAFYKYNDNSDVWEIGYKQPRKKIVWDRLEIEKLFVIRKRVKSKKEIMAKDFEKNGLIS